MAWCMGYGYLSFLMVYLPTSRLACYILLGHYDSPNLHLEQNKYIVPYDNASSTS
jgi:hypothetical protein